MDEFLARLKQRKLVQWALAYIAAAFALIQMIDVVASRFDWPATSLISWSGITCKDEHRRV